MTFFDVGDRLRSGAHRILALGLGLVDDVQAALHHGNDIILEVMRINGIGTHYQGWGSVIPRSRISRFKAAFKRYKSNSYTSLFCRGYRPFCYILELFT